MEVSYEECGYKVFRQAFRREDITTLSGITYDLLTRYRGKLLRESGKMEFNEFLPEASRRDRSTDAGSYAPLIAYPVLNAHLALPEGLDPVHRRIADLITSQALFERLHLLDGAEHYAIHQTVLFFATPTTSIHIDSWSLDTAPRGAAHTVWIPMEDMNHESGVPGVIPWPRGKLLTEEELGLSAPSECSSGERRNRYQTALAQKLLSDGSDVVSSFVRSGDLMVWSSLTPHCTLPPQPRYRRQMALQVQVRPARTRWGNYAVQPVEAAPDRARKINDRFSFVV